MTSAWDLTSSPFFSVIGTNHTPSSEELDRLRALLAGPLDERSRLRLEIARLVSEEKRIEEYVEAHQALMSPIRRIPQELLAEIFVRCLPDSSPYGVRSLKYAPLLLLGVCKHWAHTALETPLLWSSLHIYFPDRLSEENASKRIAGIALWLKRSAALPISLSIHGATSFQHVMMAQDPYNMGSAQSATTNPNFFLELRLAFIYQGMPDPGYLVDDAFGLIGVDNTDRASSAILESRMTTIFSHIICPSLKFLYVGHWASTTGFGSLALSRCPFTNLPLYSLETLSLDLLMKPETLTECLSLATSLTTLELLNQGLSEYSQDRDTQDPGLVCTFQDIHLKRLTPSSDNFDCLCPELENFRMIDRAIGNVPGESITTWSTSALTAFIEARAHAPNHNEIRPLRSCTLFLQSPRSFLETELETLHALKMTGRMKLTLNQSKTYQMPQDDGATTGLFPPSVPSLVSWPTGFILPNAIHTFEDLDSMDENNTDIII